MEIFYWTCELGAIVAFSVGLTSMVLSDNLWSIAIRNRALPFRLPLTTSDAEHLVRLSLAVGVCTLLNSGAVLAEKGTSDTKGSGDKKSNETSATKSGDKKSNDTSATKSGDKKSSETSATKGSGDKKSSETSATKGSGDKKSNETSATKSGDKKSNETSATKSGDQKSSETSATKSGDKKSSEANATKSGDKKSSETSATKSGDKKSSETSATKSGDKKGADASATKPVDKKASEAGKPADKKAGAGKAAAKPTGPVSIIVEVAAEETSDPVMLKPGKYFVLSKSSAGDKQKFGPFALGAGKPYILEFSGSVTPKIDKDADTSELGKDKTMLSIKNPLHDDYSFKIKEDESDAKKANTHANVVGRWKMGAISGDCIFYANGRCRLTEHDKSTGTWKPIAPNIIKVRWSNGWWSTFNVSEDGTSIYGRSAWGEDTENGKKDWAEKIE